MTESLKTLLGNLHAERVATWKPEDLQPNIDQRRELVEAFDPAKVVAVGDTLEDVALIDVEGGAFTLDDLVARGPAVLIFFRFAGCPACNIALPYYQRNLWPALEAAGVRLVAISPQVPERLGEIRTRQGLGFTVASDAGNGFARSLGITFETNAASRAYAIAKGALLPDTIGTGTWELPQPTVIVVDQDRVVRFVDVTPDWMARTEAGPILRAVQALTPAVAA